MKRVYSIAVLSSREVVLESPVVLLCAGANVFTAVTDDIDGLRQRLASLEGVHVQSVNCIEQPKTKPGDIFSVGDKVTNEWNNDKVSDEEAKRRTLALMEERGRPVLIGEVALACGTLWGIEDAAALLEQLVAEGLVEKVPGALEQYGRVKKEPEAS